MSAMIAWPPPKEKSDKGAKTRKMPRSRLSMPGFFARKIDFGGNAQRREDEHDRDHRPAQHAHCDEDREGKERRDKTPYVLRQLRPKLHHHADVDRDPPALE